MDATPVHRAESCRAETASPVDSLRWLPAGLFALFVVANVGVHLYVGHSSVAHRFHAVPVEFGLFTALLGAVVGVAAASGLYFGCALVGLVRLARGVSVATVVTWVAIVLVVGGSVIGALFLGAAGAPDSIDRTLAIRTRPITVVTGLCAMPGLLGFLAVRSIARDDTRWYESGACRLRLLLRLRAEIRRLLAVLLGVFFLSASSAVDRRAGDLVDEFAPLPDPADAEISQRIARRDDLAGQVGLGGSWRTFESVVVVAAPLLTALIGSATSG